MPHGYTGSQHRGNPPARLQSIADNSKDHSSLSFICKVLAVEAMSDSESDGEFVYYGTPLAAPEEVTRRHEFQKTEVKDTTVVQSLPVWKQV